MGQWNKKSSRRILLGYAIMIVLLGGVVLGPMPIAVADDDDDDDKFEKLKDKLKKLKDKIKDKCKEHKYGNICDKKDPKVDIVSPEKKQQVSGPLVTIQVKAEDNQSGIKKVQIRIDDGSYQTASYNGATGFWEITADLDSGRHKITAIAKDWAKNDKRDQQRFYVNV